MPLKLRLLGVRVSSFKLVTEENDRHNQNNEQLPNIQSKISNFVQKQETKHNHNHNHSTNEELQNREVSSSHHYETDIHQRDKSKEDFFETTSTHSEDSSISDDLEKLSPTAEIYKRLNKKIKEKALTLTEKSNQRRNKRTLLESESESSQSTPNKKSKQQTIDFFFKR
jgi:hypothetical protein